MSEAHADGEIASSVAASARTARYSNRRKKELIQGPSLLTCGRSPPPPAIKPKTDHKRAYSKIDRFGICKAARGIWERAPGGGAANGILQLSELPAPHEGVARFPVVRRPQEDPVHS